MNMTGLMKSRLGDEKIEAFEQEPFFHHSTSFEHNGIQATLNTLSKWIISVMFGAFIIWRHDVEAVWAATGSILNAGLSTVLKKILNQERPFSTTRADPGMPSSHAQSIFFIVTFIILSMVEGYKLNAATTVLGAIIFTIGGYFSWLRVSQKLHTVSQVVVGALLGLSFAFLWYWSWNAIVLQAFASSLLIRIAVILGAAVVCLAFLAYVIQYWVMDAQ
ncbi:protein modifying enzyme [Lithospermum erythrorhizon]|uniref:Protein modifying enzyme n=1 Tax=Lithospermum erythrorhizon TaxID=34254 RepID=A0AAV3PFI0_LITER